MFRRAVGSLLARRFSPCATPRMAPAPARSLHSRCFYSDLQLQAPPSCFSSRSTQRDLAIGDGLLNAYIFAAGTLAGGGGALVVRHFKEGTGVDESAAGKVNHKVKFKKPDMKARFERWIVENNKTYRDEEEKAMRFELFKASLESMESQLPSVEESGVLPEVSYFADFTDEERRKMYGIDRRTEYNEMVKSAWAKQEKGEALIRRPDMKQGDTRATQGSA